MLLLRSYSREIKGWKEGEGGWEEAAQIHLEGSGRRRGILAGLAKTRARPEGGGGGAAGERDGPAGNAPWRCWAEPPWDGPGRDPRALSPRCPGLSGARSLRAVFPPHSTEEKNRGSERAPGGTVPPAQFCGCASASRSLHVPGPCRGCGIRNTPRAGLPMAGPGQRTWRPGGKARRGPVDTRTDRAARSPGPQGERCGPL
ncbi:hypothetical protein P7K49_010775 [Saguinus oedipus]|uniref:Uncharacterized protein n=1 Tax=Saguinus oedipus TaxID=9490 RepID=A0ABQ9VNR2_SAGOE|nr:hypothetical protein P7K49_010775 [Saguinus oedipus]